MNKDEFVELAAKHVETHFPRGKSASRGAAMVLVGMITVDLIKHGVITDDSNSTGGKQL